MKTFVIGMLSFLCIPLTVAAQSETQLKMPGPGAQKLMVGTWSITVQYEPSKEMPKGNVASGEEKWYVGPGGASLVEEYHERGSAGEITGLGISWWDPERNGYRVVWCESTNPAGCTIPNSTAHWDGDQLVLISEELQGGRKMIFKEVFSEITKTSFKQSLYKGEGDDLKLVLTIHATRTLVPK